MSWFRSNPMRSGGGGDGGGGGDEARLEAIRYHCHQIYEVMSRSGVSVSGDDIHCVVSQLEQLVQVRQQQCEQEKQLAASYTESLISGLADAITTIAEDSSTDELNKDLNDSTGSLNKLSRSCSDGSTTATLKPASPMVLREPNIGPLLTALLSKLEEMLENSLFVNLLLTAVISALATYPQPLLRSFLLNTNLVFQPSVRSLVQVLGSIKHRLDTYSHTVDNFEDLLLRGRRYLVRRQALFQQETLISSSSSSSSSSSKQQPTGISMLPSATVLPPPTTNTGPQHPVKEKQGRGRSITDFLFRRHSSSQAASDGASAYKKDPRLESIPECGGYRFINKKSPDVQEEYSHLETLKLRNVVYSAIVLEEFLKEIAALSQEHPTVT